MDKSITQKMIDNYQEEFDNDVKLKISRNAATHNEITFIGFNGQYDPSSVIFRLDLMAK